MKTTDLAGIHDILPYETPVVWPYILASTLFLIAVILLAMVLRHHLHPLSRLQRKLKTGRISTRQAAHRLAELVQHNSEHKAEIDALRFSRQPPTPASLLHFIAAIRGRNVF